MTQHSFSSLMRRLAAAGFKRDFARIAVLPDWWDSSCEGDPALLPDIELRVARFVGVPLEAVRDPSAPLLSPRYEGAQLRRVRDINKDRLAPAIHGALRVSAAVLRNIGDLVLRLPPSEPTAWRDEMMGTGRVLHLRDVLADLWKRGIPVIHQEMLPTPCFQGLAAVIDGRPVIVLAHDLDEPARLAFIVAHEVGHIVAGDCAEDRPVVDEQEEVSDDADIEKRADQYATLVTTGGLDVPNVQASGYKELALKADAIEKQQGIDASAVVWAWARRSGNYAMASMASQALYRTKGGKRALREFVDQYVRLDDASDSDRALLRCLGGDPQRDAAAS